MPESAADDDVARRARAVIRDIPDFPKPGIIFKDITPLLATPALFREVTDAMAAPFAKDGITHVVAIESRGFILGAPVAQRLGAGFIPVRKPGKLPHTTASIEYELEYGTDQLQVHTDACGVGARVLIGAAVVGFSFLMVLSFLPGDAKLAPLGGTVERLVTY
jgi:adenine phosphoribosyltransferase